MNETKNEEETKNETKKNTTNDIYQSDFNSQLEEMTKLKSNLNKEKRKLEYYNNERMKRKDIKML